MPEITIIGTSHIARQSLQEVEKQILEKKPDIVALELDRKRYYSLLHKSRSINLSAIRRIRLKGFLFALIGGWAEKKLGQSVGVYPGEEMMTAIRLAKKLKIKVAFIDQDIEITLQKISNSLTWKEKWNFITDIFNAIFFRKREMKKLGIKELDLSKVPAKDLIKKLLKKVKERYPNIHKVLIEERNQIMASNLKNLEHRFPDKKIIAIVGAGHEEDISDILKNSDIAYSFTIS